jgi:uncharacterized membrane protein YiaA
MLYGNWLCQFYKHYEKKDKGAIHKWRHKIKGRGAFTFLWQCGTKGWGGVPRYVTSHPNEEGCFVRFWSNLWFLKTSYFDLSRMVKKIFLQFSNKKTTFQHLNLNWNDAFFTRSCNQDKLCGKVLLCISIYNEAFSISIFVSKRPCFFTKIKSVRKKVFTHISEVLMLKDEGMKYFPIFSMKEHFSSPWD